MQEERQLASVMLPKLVQAQLHRFYQEATYKLSTGTTIGPLTPPLTQVLRKWLLHIFDGLSVSDKARNDKRCSLVTYTSFSVMPKLMGRTEAVASKILHALHGDAKTRMKTITTMQTVNDQMNIIMHEVLDERVSDLDDELQHFTNKRQS